MASAGSQPAPDPGTGPQRIDYAQFLALLTARFPEVPAADEECRRGLLHCEMGTFARLTEEAVDRGNFWRAEQYFRLVEEVRANATPEVENVIDVSYLEWLAFSEVTENRRRAIRERMPESLRTILLAIDDRGCWR
jgi:hypothetical protein